MKCLNCNQECADNSKFCPFCGTPAAAPAPAAGNVVASVSGLSVGNANIPTV